MAIAGNWIDNREGTVMIPHATRARWAARTTWASTTVGIVCAIAAGSARADSGPTGKLVYTGSDGIYVQRIDGTAARRVWNAPKSGEGSEPRWSDDGARIAFDGPDGNIWVMNADGSNLQAVNTQAVSPSGCGEDGCEDPGTSADSPRWSHDGSQLSYRLVERLATGSIWTVPAQNGYTPRLVASASDLCIFNEGWTPDEKPLFSRCESGGSPSNATYTVTSSQQAVVAGSQVAFSADGNRLAFSNHALTNGSVPVNLFIAAKDGSGARMVARGGQNPEWSRNGLLAYQTASADGWTIRVYDPTSGSDTLVGSGTLGGWTPDGGYLYYTTDTGSGPAIWRVRSDGSNNQMIAAGNFPDWAP